MKLSKKNILFSGLLVLAGTLHSCIPFGGNSASSLLDATLQNATPISAEKATSALQSYCGDNGQAFAAKLSNNGEAHFQAGYTEHFDHVGASFPIGRDSTGKLVRTGPTNEFSRISQMMLPPHEEFDYAELIRGACGALRNTLDGSGKGYPRYEAVQATVSGSLAHGRANLGSCVGMSAANPETSTEATILFCENGLMQKAETTAAGQGNKSAIVMQGRS